LRRDDVLFDTPNACNVLGSDAQRTPLLFGLVVAQPEMHDTVPVEGRMIETTAMAIVSVS
jgi:hypothetical protein